MSIIIYILIGTAAGLMARPLMQGPSAGGLKIAIPLGIAGALIGGVIGALLAGEFSVHADSRGVLLAMIATMAVLFSYRSYVMRWEPMSLSVGSPARRKN